MARYIWSKKQEPLGVFSDRDVPPRSASHVSTCNESRQDEATPEKTGRDCTLTYSLYHSRGPGDSGRDVMRLCDERNKSRRSLSFSKVKMGL